MDFLDTGVVDEAHCEAQLFYAFITPPFPLLHERRVRVG